MDNPRNSNYDRRQRNIWQYCPGEGRLYDPANETRSFFERTGLSEDRIEEICKIKKGVGSHILGAAGEFGFKDHYLDVNPDIQGIHFQDDHNKNEKGDFSFIYKGLYVSTLEVKTAKRIEKSKAKKKKPEYPFRTAASISHRDKKMLYFPDGSVLETGAVIEGEYDILAINFWHCFGQHVFSFVRLDDLPREGAASTSKSLIRATPEQKAQLIKGSVQVTWPPVAPFTDDLCELLDEEIIRRKISHDDNR